MKILITSIQRFCLHDGPGIRTTVFLKGCNLHCPWCCNPENIDMHLQYYYKKEKCIADNGNCKYGICPFSDLKVTRKKLLKITCDEYTQCKSGALGMYGKYYNDEELLMELYKDWKFWAHGGVTFSGGEPLLQFYELQPVLAKLRKDKVSICIETALCVDKSIVESAISYIDIFFVDIKIADAQRMKRVVGGDFDLLLKNLEILKNHNAHVIIRHPMIKNYTDDEENMIKIRAILRKFPKFEYQELNEHHLGDDKYRSLGLL